MDEKRPFFFLGCVAQGVEIFRIIVLEQAGVDEMLHARMNGAGVFFPTRKMPGLAQLVVPEAIAALGPDEVAAEPQIMPFTTKRSQRRHRDRKGPVALDDTLCRVG